MHHLEGHGPEDTEFIETTWQDVCLKATDGKEWKTWIA